MSGDSVPAQAPLVVNGWSIYAHPLFLDQLEGLIKEVEARKARDPKTWQKKNCAKRLAGIFKLVEPRTFVLASRGARPNTYGCRFERCLRLVCAHRMG